MVNKYWENRNKQKLKSHLKEADETIRKLNCSLDKAAREIENNIFKLYGKYAQDNKLSFSEAQKKLTNDEYKYFKKDIVEYVNEINTTKDERLLFELNTLSTKSRISRLEETFFNIQKQLDKDYKFKHDEVRKLLERGVKKSFVQTAFDIDSKLGFHGNFAMLNKKEIDDIINLPWSGKNYSQRLWNNRTLLKNKLEEQLTQSIIQGKDLRLVTKEISETMDTTKKVTERLVNTEHAYACAQGDLKMYVEFDIKAYQYDAALDSKTSSICRGLDQKVYNVDEASPGINFPPMHPHCRSSTVPYVDDIDDSTRIAKDENGKYIYLKPDVSYNDYEKAINTGNWDNIRVVKDDEKIYNDIKGAVSGALNPFGDRAVEHAERYYDSVRKMTNDSNRIAQNTGYRMDDIDKIKGYIFIDKHDLGRGSLERFDPDYMMAQSWQRLIDGKNIKLHDLILLDHEFYELTLIKMGHTQREAHIITSKIYNYSKGAEEYYANIKKYKD